MLKKTCLIALALVGVFSAIPASAKESSFLALCYHNVEDKDPDQAFDGATTSKLVEELAWLKHEGYQAVTVDQILAAKAGKKPLPEKAMLLTFDDGYESFYTRVYPVLKAFNMPAVLAIVDKWLDDGSGKGQHGQGGDHMVMYGSVYMPRDFFLKWSQIREMSDSGLVEVASHSDGLHLGILANPQGNTEPSATTMKYDAKKGTYETAQAYAKRIQADAANAAATIKKQLGKAPRVLVWPYGSYNDLGVSIAASNGMPITLTLDDGFSTVSNLKAVPRQLINRDPEIGDFAVNTRYINKTPTIRAVQVDLDYLYDADPTQLAHNMDILINRIHDLQINRVFLQAFANPQGDGLARELYFPNRHLPMRADLFNRVAWQLKTRANVDVYGWLPVLSFDLKGATHIQAVDKDGNVGMDSKAYRRISPYDAEGRRKIMEIYEDMSRQAPIDGLLFHDDAIMSDFEDVSAPALTAYQRAGLPTSPSVIKANPAMLKKWTNFKTTTLINFTHDLASHAAKYHAPIKTVRNIYAPVVLNPQSEEWFAQNYERFLDAYDYTAIEAMPKMENIPDSEANDWLLRLVATASRHPNGLSKTVFELQSVDWREKDSDDRVIPTEELGAQMRLLARHGALNLGYYPDDFINNTPDVSVLHKDFSLQTYPYQP